MSNYKKTALKLYIQDVFRAKQVDKYVYEIFGKTFKNVMLHGVVTSVYNTSAQCINLELSDPTASVQVYCKGDKNNKLPSSCIDDLTRSYSKTYKFGDHRTDCMSFLLKKIQDKNNSILQVKEGDYLSIIGDIFVEDFKNTRMISGYEWHVTSIESDVLWLEDLRFLYDKCYLKS